MKRFYTFLASLLLIVSCSDTNSSTYTEADALEFLERIEKEDETLGPIASSAYWIGSNFITYDSQKIVSDFDLGSNFTLTLGAYTIPNCSVFIF